MVEKWPAFTPCENLQTRGPGVTLLDVDAWSLGMETEKMGPLHDPVTWYKIIYTVEPRFNEPLFNEVLDITNDILGPGQSYSKMYGIEPRYNEPRYNEFLDITNIFRKTKRKIYLDITKCNVNTREKMNAEQINSQQIF